MLSKVPVTRLVWRSQVNYILEKDWSTCWFSKSKLKKIKLKKPLYFLQFHLILFPHYKLLYHLACKFVVCTLFKTVLVSSVNTIPLAFSSECLSVWKFACKCQWSHEVPASRVLLILPCAWRALANWGIYTFFVLQNSCKRNKSKLSESIKSLCKTTANITNWVRLLWAVVTGI